MSSRLLSILVLATAPTVPTFAAPPNGLEPSGPANSPAQQAAHGPSQTLTWEVDLEGARRRLLLERLDLRAEGFQAYVRAQDGSSVPVEVGPSRVYRGVVEGLSGAVVTAIHRAEGSSATIQYQDRSWNVSLKNSKDGPLASIAVEAAMDSSSMCGVAPGLRGLRVPAGSIALTTLPVVAEVACHVDYRAYAEYGSTTGGAMDLVESRLATASYFYELYTGIQFQLTAVQIETASSTDPFYSVPATAGDLLVHFQKIWNGTDTHVPPHSPPGAASAARDGAILLTGHNAIEGNINGMANVGYMGYLNWLSYSFTVTGGLSPTKEAVVLAHETGHMFGAAHCGSDCGIMSFSSSTNAYFAEDSIDAIVDQRETYAASWSAGTATVAPVISTASPAQFQVLSQPQVTLTGSGLDTAVHVDVGSLRLYIDDFSIASSSSLSFDAPVLPVGSQTVFAVGAGGASNSVTLDYVASTTLELVPAGDPLALVPYAPFTWHYGGPVGNTVTLLMASSLQTVVVNGHNVLRFGTVVDSGTVPSAGFRSHEETPTSPGSFWVQALMYSSGVLVDATDPLEHYVQ